MPLSSARSSALAACHGYRVEADDGPLGTVETPLFPPDHDEPDYLIVRVRERFRSRLPVVTVALVDDVRPDRRTLRLRGRRGNLARLPEQLPLAQ